jgi:diacylglycerol kinase family enzyme
MRIALYFNPGAGDEMPLETLTTAITRAGHEISAVLHEKDDLAAAREMAIDVLVAAGGDGTVAKAARVLAGRDLPIAILPLGTANNIATTLGITGSSLREVEQWHTRQIVRIDTGVVTDDHGERVFIEGVGTGLVPAGIRKGNSDPRKHESPDAAAEVEWARTVFIDALAELRPRHSRVCIDDEEIEGEYLLVEVLNVASVGPRLRLSAETTPADGFLSVVAGGPDDRAAIDAHLRLPWDQDDSHAWLKSWRARRVIARGWHEYHVDDKVRMSESGEVTIEIRPASLAVLA